MSVGMLHIYFRFHSVHKGTHKHVKPVSKVQDIKPYSKFSFIMQLKTSLTCTIDKQI